MSTKKGFTLIELIVATSLFGIGLIAVFIVLNSGFNTMSQARGQVVAINLAREGAEMMFNIRDTNLRKRSGKRDQCWLNKSSLFAAAQDTCEAEEFLGWWNGGGQPVYMPYYGITTGGGRLPLMRTTTGITLNISDGITATEEGFELVLNGSGVFTPVLFFSGGGAFSPGQCNYPVTGGSSLLTLSSGCPATYSYSPAGRFYRVIDRPLQYDKAATVTGGRLLKCQNGGATDATTSQPCGTSIPKELRFCSEVQYVVGKARRTVRICSVMSNFKE